MKNKIKVGDQVYPLPSLPDQSQLERIPGGRPPYILCVLGDTEQKKHHRKTEPGVTIENISQENATNFKSMVVCHLPASFFEQKKK